MTLAGLRITKYNLAVLALTLLGLALRVYQLTTQSIWLDEAHSVWMAELGTPQMVTLAATGDLHPPLYFFILHWWSLLFSTSEGAVRSLPVVFGVLAIPMTYAVGRQLFNKEAGLIGALLLALSSFNIQYSQETRMYSLMVLLALVSMYFFIRLLKQRTPFIMVGYALSTVLLLYAHIYGLFILVVQNIYFLTLYFLAHKRTFHMRRWIALEAIVGALFAPWFIVLVSRVTHMQEEGFWIPRPTIDTIVQILTTYAGTSVLLALFLALAVLSLLTYRKVHGAMDWKGPINALRSYKWEVRLHNLGPVYLLVIWVLVLNIIPFIISRVTTPFYLDKYTIAASVALYLLVAAGVSNVKWNYAKVGIILVIGILCVANVQPYYAAITKPQGREAVNTVIQNAKSGDLVLVWPWYHSFVFAYYSTPADALNPIYGADYHSARGDLAVGLIRNDSDAAIVNETHSAVEGYDRIWWIYAYREDTSEQAYSAILAGLNESYELSFSKYYFGYDVYLFEKRPAAAGSQQTTITFTAPTGTQPSGSTWTVSGYLRDSTGAGVANKPVTLTWHLEGETTWHPWTTVRTNDQGYWSTTDTSTQLQYYKATFVGGSSYAGSSQEIKGNVSSSATQRS